MLRLGGLATGSAVFTIFLPQETMAAVHQGLGLGAFPEAPLTGYLTRSLSAMYAFHGLILWCLSRDVVGYRRILVPVAWATLAMGVLLLGIDLHSDMPKWWTWIEGPGVAGFGVLLVGLTRHLERP